MSGEIFLCECNLSLASREATAVVKAAPADEKAIPAFWACVQAGLRSIPAQQPPSLLS